ncbi:MAG: FAD-dependent monooxygenase [Granulosicoccus sp.]
MSNAGLPTHMHSESVDIIIVGAGLVGAPLAAVLGNAGWSVALLDEKPQAPKDSVASTASLDALSQRCTALSLGSKQWLAEHSLWDMIADEACPIEQVCVTHKGYFGATRLHAHELDADAVGFVVNNDRLSNSVLQLISETSVKHFSGVRVSSVSYEDDTVQVSCTRNLKVRGRLLVAADGVSSMVRESAGIQTRQVDYDQSAVLGSVQLSNAHNGVAYERFTPSGPLALLPQSGQYMSFVDCIDPGEQADIEQLDDAAYLDRLQTRFGHRLGSFVAVGPRFVIPLVRIEATQQVAHRTILLGNAVRLLHPVGGQGYNLALRDVAELVRLLTGESGSTDPGDKQLLARFIELRSRDQKQVVLFTDALARGFRGRASLPGHFRSLCLLGLDTLSPARREFAKRTMGLAR